MAIAFDNAARSGSGSGTTHTWSYTVNDNTHGILFVWLQQNSHPGNCTGVTYNGVAMTQYATYTFLDNSTLFYLFNPSVGTHNIVESYSVSQSFTGSDALSYTGVKQSGFPDYSSGFQSNSSATSITCTVIPTTSGCWGVMFGDINRSFSSGTNYTNRIGSGNDLAGDSNGTLSGSTNMTITQGSASSISAVAVSIAPFLPSATLTEGLIGTDSIIRSVSRAITEGLIGTDKVLKSTARALIEGLIGTDSVLGLRVLVGTFTEGLIGTDSIVRSIARSLSEGLIGTDAISFVKTLAITLVEGWQMLDVFGEVKVLLYTFYEGLVATDSFSWTAPIRTGWTLVANTVTTWYLKLTGN